jgi:multimeric flavodoxin WrbA
MEVRLNFCPLLAMSHFNSYLRTGSPWGAGTFAGPTGARSATELEKEIATIQGKAFYETVAKVNFK